jgi:hypothetical protein
MSGSRLFHTALAAAMCILLIPAGLQAAATIVIQVGDGAGVGFNDPTVVAPVGGNSGTTLGQQRLIAFQAAANKWGATITSVPAITIKATWSALSCTSTSAVLGSAGAVSVWRDFPGAPKPGTWFPAALANKLLGSDADPANAEISANFNVNLGQTGCLDGTFFYLGLDGNHGANVDLVTVLEHEFAHGLGFQDFTSGTTGAFISGFPSIWDYFLYDNTAGKLWIDMTAAERVASAINPRKLVWTGANVTAGVTSVLSVGTPLLSVTSPASVAGSYDVGTATFGPALSSPGVTAEVMPVVDSPGNLGLACAALSAANAAAVSGKIALVDRGTCTFNTKVKNCQNAGALGVLVADNAAGAPPAGLGGTDATITIPSVRITQADGVTLKNALKTRSRLHSGMFATLGVNLLFRAGADANGRALMYTPNPFQGGSSVSHYDTSAFPNLLMEPSINADLTHEVIPPFDLTFPLLRDIGW